MSLGRTQDSLGAFRQALLILSRAELTERGTAAWHRVPLCAGFATVYRESTTATMEWRPCGGCHRLRTSGHPSNRRNASVCRRSDVISELRKELRRGSSTRLSAYACQRRLSGGIPPGAHRSALSEPRVPGAGRLLHGSHETWSAVSVASAVVSLLHNPDQTHDRSPCKAERRPHLHARGLMAQ